MIFGLKNKFKNLLLPIVQYKSNGKPHNIKPFDPVDHGLPADFVLTNYTKMKGWGCKIPQNKLLTYLKNLPTPVGV